MAKVTRPTREMAIPTTFENNPSKLLMVATSAMVSPGAVSRSFQVVAAEMGVGSMKKEVRSENRETSF